ncbi:MAG TPA: tripartite tricarboxylate transporter substrate binding protein [Xanthobacteraceae bacterium]|jgi:tripartite-type tricarboxylate transporter receptor subunit TctC|nr:tripartite tricarboxylate transporter substrate binding protein [Xanthobacteraceae bacterium]
MNSIRLLSALVSLMFTALIVQAAQAASFPSRPVKIIVAFPPGGGPDPLARIVAAGLEQRLGEPFVVENVPGANGAMAARNTIHGGPDGYTLLFADMTFIASPHVTADFGVNPLKDFEPVGWVAASPFSLITSSLLPAASVADFIKLTKANPDGILVGHAGIGTTPYLAAISFTEAADIHPRLVGYKGVADAMTNAMAGIISGVFSAGPAAISASHNDKLKVLAVTGTKRMMQLPDVPTFGEGGIALRGFESGAWFGLMAPAGTPEEILERINTALNDSTNDPTIQAKFLSAGAETKSGPPSDFGKLLIQQDELWGRALTKDAH